jgi:hypothetical protein
MLKVPSHLVLSNLSCNDSGNDVEEWDAFNHHRAISGPVGVRQPLVETGMGH